MAAVPGHGFADGPPGPGAFALGTAIRAGSRDPVELVDATLDRIDRLDPSLGAFVEVDADGARAAARACRDALRRGDEVGPLHGVPVAVKDLYDVAGSVTRAGSQVPAGPPAERDATAVARLRAAGAVIVGRTRTHEFAWGLTTQHARLGGARNPHDPTRIPGGSSGGSAVAVAAGLVPLALGTDTGCSIRLPAAFCGLAGHKPTAGLIPLDGVLPLAPSMDTGGALVRDVGDARSALELLSGVPLPASEPSRGLRIGIVDFDGADVDVPMDASVASVLDGAYTRAASLVAGVRRVSLPLLDRGVDIYRGIQGREALRWHRATGRWPAHETAYGDDVRGRLRACAEMSADELDEADRLRARLRGQVTDLLGEVDLLLLPVATCSPGGVDDPDRVRLVTASGTLQDADLRAAVLPWTVPANLGGWPACSVPVGRDAQGLPVGAQLLGPVGSDARVLDLAAELAVPL